MAKRKKNLGGQAPKRASLADRITSSSALVTIVSVLVVFLPTVVAAFFSPVNDRWLESLFPYSLAFAFAALVLYFIVKSQLLSSQGEIVQMARKIADYERSGDSFSEIIDMLESVTFESDEVISRIRSAKLEKLKNEFQPEDYQLERLLNRVEKDFIDYTRVFLDSTSKIFELRTGHRCATCVKSVLRNAADEKILLSPKKVEIGQNTPKVKTFYRDSHSNRNRKKTDEMYPYVSIFSSNGYSQIASNDLEEDVFACDDLGKSPVYANANRSWRKFYNATLVAPIWERRFEYSRDKHRFEALGKNLFAFLCIDNSAGGFENPSAKFLCYSLATQYSIVALEYMSFMGFDELRRIGDDDRDYRSTQGRKPESPMGPAVNKDHD